MSLSSHCPGHGRVVGCRSDLFSGFLVLRRGADHGAVGISSEFPHGPDYYNRCLFVFEFVMQRRVVPFLFPEGSLSATPGTIRLRIRIRLVAFLFASNLIPFLTFLYAVHGSFQSHLDPVEILNSTNKHYFTGVNFHGVGVWLVFW